MKNWYVVSFMYDKDVYCTNLCIADSKEQAEKHYSKEFEWVSVKAADDWEVDSYKRRGMPITTL